MQAVLPSPIKVIFLLQGQMQSEVHDQWDHPITEPTADASVVCPQFTFEPAGVSPPPYCILDLAHLMTEELCEPSLVSVSLKYHCRFKYQFIDPEEAAFFR